MGPEADRFQPFGSNVTIHGLLFYLKKPASISELLKIRFDPLSTRSYLCILSELRWHSMGFSLVFPTNMQTVTFFLVCSAVLTIAYANTLSFYGGAFQDNPDCYLDHAERDYSVPSWIQ